MSEMINTIKIYIWNITNILYCLKYETSFQRHEVAKKTTGL